MIQACLNGDRAGAPATPEELAEAAAGAVAAGAAELHVHPRAPDGRDSLDPDHVSSTLDALRRACPGVPIGLTTGMWAAGGDPSYRLALVGSWRVLPDYVSANVSEEGFAELCGLVASKGMGIEAGVWSVDDVSALAAAAPPLLRVLVEVGDGVGEPARALEISAALAAAVDAPQLHHGEGLTTWAVLRAALDRGHDVRVGLEDTAVLPDGTPARDNAELVAAVATYWGRRTAG